MADFNENQNGVFGGVQFNEGNNNSVENTSYFDGNVQNGNEANTGNVFGSFGTSNAGSYNGTIDNATNFQPIEKEKAITKQGLWSRVKAFLFQEIDLTAPVKIELTPYQQKVENEINEFLHQEITFKGIANLFKRKK